MAQDKIITQGDSTKVIVTQRCERLPITSDIFTVPSISQPPKPPQASWWSKAFSFSWITSWWFGKGAKVAHQDNIGLVETKIEAPELKALQQVDSEVSHAPVFGPVRDPIQAPERAQNSWYSRFFHRVSKGGVGASQVPQKIEPNPPQESKEKMGNLENPANGSHDVQQVEHNATLVQDAIPHQDSALSQVEQQKGANLVGSDVVQFNRNIYSTNHRKKPQKIKPNPPQESKEKMGNLENPANGSHDVQQVEHNATLVQDAIPHQDSALSQVEQQKGANLVGSDVVQFNRNIYSTNHRKKPPESNAQKTYRSQSRDKKLSNDSDAKKGYQAQKPDENKEEAGQAESALGPSEKPAPVAQPKASWYSGFLNSISSIFSFIGLGSSHDLNLAQANDSDAQSKSNDSQVLSLEQINNLSYEAKVQQLKNAIDRDDVETVKKLWLSKGFAGKVDKPIWGDNIAKNHTPFAYALQQEKLKVAEYFSTQQCQITASDQASKQLTYPIHILKNKLSDKDYKIIIQNIISNQPNAFGETVEKRDEELKIIIDAQATEASNQPPGEMKEGEVTVPTPISITPAEFEKTKLLLEEKKGKVGEEAVPVPAQAPDNVVAPPHVQNDLMMENLKAAIDQNNYELVQNIINNNQDLLYEPIREYSGGNPLCYAIETSDGEEKSKIIDFLVSKQQETPMTEQQKERILYDPVHCAVLCNKIQTVQYFVGQGMAITSSSLIAAHRKAEIMDYLLSQNIDQRELNKALRGAHFESELIEKLIDKGAEINSKNHSGNTVLHKVAQCQDMVSMQVLLGHGADLNIKNHKGDTPLHTAAKYESCTSMRVLLKNNADLNVQNEKGNTPLHKAAYYGDLDSMQVLLEKNPDVNVQNNKGETVLHLVEGKDNFDDIKTLIKSVASNQCLPYKNFLDTYPEYGIFDNNPNDLDLPGDQSI